MAGGPNPAAGDPGPRLRYPCTRGNAVDSLVMLRKAKTWLVKVMPFLARWGSNTTPNP
jgi:hypothetical protein